MGHRVHQRVLAFIEDSRTGQFGDLAMQVFAHQYEYCSPYRLYCERRGITPDNVPDWTDIPAVPIQAFKATDLSCGPPQRVFRSTGTTTGPSSRSRHLMPDVRLYEHSAITGMRRFLFADVVSMRLLSLIPPADEQPDSSLSQMISWAFAELGTEDSHYTAGPGGIDFELCTNVLRESEIDGRPLCIMTTTGAAVHLLDHARHAELSFRLPHGSRLMDTGGGKGAPRTLSAKGFLHAVWNTFAIPGYFCVNEYGMAELSSQYYDSVLRDRFDGRHRGRHKSAPHWLRTLVVDPASLRPVAQGQRGLLCHFDLANAASAMAVLSEDIGVVDSNGLQLLGRAAGAEARGCSMSAAEWTKITNTHQP